MAQKQIAPTTQIIKTPIKTEIMAIPCTGAVATRVRDPRQKRKELGAPELRLTRREGARPQKTTQSEHA
jgi:hypothetical protein